MSLGQQMNLEPITQGEVSQKEKNKYYVLMHIYGVQKNGTDEPISRAVIEICIENRLLDSVEEGEGGMN